jgi:hypothetical protein
MGCWTLLGCLSNQPLLSSLFRCHMAYGSSSGCRASRVITHAVRASMPGPNSAARRRACHVVRGSEQLSV